MTASEKSPFDDITKIITDESLSAIQVVDEDGLVVYCNKKSKQLHGIIDDTDQQHSIFDFTTYFRNSTEWNNHVETLKNIPSFTFTTNHKNVQTEQEFPVEVQSFYRKLEGKGYVIATTKNISEDLQTQRQIQHAQRLLEIAGEMADLGGWAYDKEVDELTWTAQTKRIHEVPLNYVPKLPDAFDFYATKDDRNRMENAFASALAEGIEYDQEFQITTAAGKKRWVRAKGKPFYKNNEIVGVEGTFQNIDKEKRQELELSNVKSRMEKVLNTMNDVIWSISLPDFKLDYVTKSIENIIGYTKDDFVNDNWEWKKLFLPEDQHYLGQIISDIISNHSYEITHRMNAKDGSTKFIKHKGKVVFNENKQPIRIDGMAFDLTNEFASNQKESNWQEQLKRQEEQYRNILTNMRVGLLEIDREDIITFVNKSFCDMSGYEIDEIVNRPVTEVFKDNQLQVINKANYFRTNGENSYNEVAFTTKKGQQRWWSISGSPQYNDKGDVIGSIGAFLDITKQKNLIEELEHSKKSAESEVSIKEQFLANISHEIRTPLNIIIGAIRLLKSLGVNNKQLEYIHQADASSKHLLAIINNVLDMAKISSGKLSIQPRPFFSRSLVDNVKSIFMLKAKEKELTFNIDVDPNMADKLHGDDVRLRQILINLLGNAIKFTENGEISLSVKVEQIDPKSQKLYFEVSDTGIGMSPEFIDKVFDQFAQEESSSTRSYGGTGLGMAISKDLVEKMGGEINVKSEKGKGTSVFFNVTLPVVVEEEEKPRRVTPAAAAAQKSESSTSNKKILLVDDNQMNRFIARETLKPLQADIDEADNGKKACEMVGNTAYDLILMDIQMPEMDGIEAIQIMRDMGVSTPIIALTANSFKEDIEKYAAAGFTDYITKPYDEVELIKTISVYLFVRQGKSKSEDISEPMDNAETENAIIEMFQQQIREDGKLLEDCIRTKDKETATKIAHKLKSGAKTLGLGALAQSLEKVEFGNAAWIEDAEKCIELFNTFMESSEA
ncbi:MAG: PAS domain S-box protein [Cryomorphaceae bacterium]|nr:PAS domain S-box protein [Cryomorphaceae bacterium]